MTNTGSSENVRRRLVLSVEDGFARVAAWQFAGFVILLLLVWLNETTDFVAFFCGDTPGAPNYLRAWLITIGVALVGIIVIGTTYLQQRSILSEVLTICPYCHKITVDKDLWQSISDRLRKKPAIELTHGICPDCIEKVKATWQQEEAEARK